jgi:hypothetical protein
MKFLKWIQEKVLATFFALAMLRLRAGWPQFFSKKHGF